MMLFTFPPMGYMNPGTGSMILQVALAGIAGLFVAIKAGWHTIKSFWTRKK